MAKSQERFEATMTRLQWRATFLRAEAVSPKYKTDQAYLQAACAEIMEVAAIEIDPVGETLMTKAFPDDDAKGAKPVMLELSREALHGIKYSAIKVLVGQGSALPANEVDRARILASLDKVGPGGVLKRLVEKDAKLPDAPDSQDPLDAELDSLAAGKSEG